MRAPDRGPSRPGDPLGRLTPREYEVALLVAGGLPNAEIARQLGLSPATVATHIQHIRHRLDLTSRAEIAAWVNAGRSPGDPAGRLRRADPTRTDEVHPDVRTS